MMKRLPNISWKALREFVVSYSACALVCGALSMVVAAAPGSALAAGPPEVSHIGIVAQTQTSIGPIFATFQTGGVETKYVLEYSPVEAGHRPAEPTSIDPGAWKSVPGGSGTVPAEQAGPNGGTRAEVEVPALTGLSPGTSYYIRLEVMNKVGFSAAVVWDATSPLHPQVDGGEFDHVAATSATFHALINPEGSETSWHLEYTTTPNVSGSWVPAPGASGTIMAGEAGENLLSIAAEIIGLSPETTYYVRTVAENADGEATVPFHTVEESNHEPFQVPPVEESQLVSIANERSVETGGKPAVVTFAAHGFGSEGEVLRALGSVKPHGADTHYFVEYVSEPVFGGTGWSKASKTASVDAGLGEFNDGSFPTMLVGVDLPGLEPGVVYRYRFVASSTAPGNPVVAGGEQVLTVPGTVQAGPELCPNASVRVGASAALPDCRAFEQVTPVQKNGAQDIFRYGIKAEGSLVAEDGEHFMLHVPGVAWGGSPDAREANYVFSRTSDSWNMASLRPTGDVSALSFLPELFSSDLTEVGIEADWETSVADKSPNIEFDAGITGEPYARVASVLREEPGGGSEWVAAAGDFKTLILQSPNHKLMGSSTGTISGDDLYEYSEGVLRQANIGAGRCGASIVDGFEDYEGNAGPGGRSSAHAISEDGSHVFFEAASGSNCSAQLNLYIRVDGTETVDVGEYVFRAANPEGSSVLIEKQVGGSHEFFLYETETKTFIKLLTIQEPIFAGGSRNLAVVSDDLTAIYFFSDGQLTEDAPPPGEGENLYVYDIGARVLRFVAQSSGNRGVNYTGHSTDPAGRYFYWISGGVGGVPGGTTVALDGPSDQVYRYDSVENTVQCMSCASSFDPSPELSATFLSTGTVGSSGLSNGVPVLRDASDNGDYVFFDTPSALVPQDVDGEVAQEGDSGEHPSVTYSVSSDVYEWRKDGVDGCARLVGCVSLITPGTGGYLNVFLGTSASGDDVFFATHEQLVLGDQDTAGDVYDARVDGGFPLPSEGAPECEPGACQRPAAGPIDATPGSMSFSGPGNVSAQETKSAGSKKKGKKGVKACGKGKARKHGKCVKVGKARRARPGSKGRAVRANRSDRRSR